jgi:hypothetical protein
MLYSFDEIEHRAMEYSTVRGMQLEQRLGFGKDGIVWATSAATAVKGHARDDLFEREFGCYQRLGACHIDNIMGHRVPLLLDWDHELRVMEITIVTPPFLLDFADAYLDEAPDFPPEVTEQWREEKMEQFGSRWPTVEAVIDLLRARYGIHLLDVHPGNMTFPEVSD